MRRNQPDRSDSMHSGKVMGPCRRRWMNGEGVLAAVRSSERPCRDTAALLCQERQRGDGTVNRSRMAESPADYGE